MADKKILKAVVKSDRDILCYVAGFPPGGRNQLMAAETKAREDLFEILIKGHSKIDQMGVEFPEGLKPTDIILKNSEWNILKECFETTGWPSMPHKHEAKNIIHKVIEAADHKG